MSQPPIGVGMPVYNGANFLEQAIRSVQQQSFGDFELIISDNASTDDTEEICRSMARHDKRIRYVRHRSNQGAAANYNQVFLLSNARYFRWFNADDVCDSELHEKCLRALESNADAVLCYGKTQIIDTSGQLIELYDDKLDLRDDCPLIRFVQCSEKRGGLTNAIYGLMRKNAMSRTHLMGRGRFPAADTVFMRELALHGKFIELPDQLFFRRIHENASSWDRESEQRQRAFWRGTDTPYTLPTWSKHVALLSAARSAPISWRAKLALFRYLMRRMRYDRAKLVSDIGQLLRRRVSRYLKVPG